MLRRRLTARFALQMAFAGILLIILTFSILHWMLKELERIEMKRSFAPVGISRLIDESTIDENGFIQNEHLIEILKQDGGWLQRLDEHGRVIQSFYTPDDVPAQYHPAQLIEYWQGRKDFPYTLGLWIQHKDEHLFIMLYGKAKQTIPLEQIQAYIASATIEHAQITFPTEITKTLTKREAWIQVIDSSGEEVASWHKPEHASSHYTLSELALRANYPDRYGHILYSHYDEVSGLTWIIQEPFRTLQNESVLDSLIPGMDSELQVILTAIALFIASTLLTMLILAFGYANMFVRPVFDIVRWIQDLSYEQQEQNIDEQKRNALSAKQPKHLFREVRDSIQTLSAALQASKQAAQQTQAYREEWIAGVTHDMRTPLSSIQGYAHMLTAEQYSWSEQEVREFAAIILEKSQYMDQLIEDLSLTYRLRSGGLPISLDMHQIPVLLEEIVERATSNPAYSQYQIIYHAPHSQESFMRNIHPLWFERIVSNLIANAVLHNEKNTTIELFLVHLTDHGWMLEVKDNGQGMDEETKELLFERYYRGTNTDENIEGSGLGMAITKELVQAMGGRIEVHSERNKGSIIQIIFDQASNKNQDQK